MISYTAATTCTITLDDGSDITVRASQNSISFVKLFMYTLGPEPDRDSENYGFDLEITGDGARVVDTRFFFQPTTPRFDPNIPEPKNGQVTITMTIDKALARSLGFTGTVTATVEVKMNTGT